MIMDTYECRICMEGIEAGRLISPCKCKGTVQYVHEHCLNEWRNHSLTPDLCNMCMSFYNNEDVALRCDFEKRRKLLENCVIFTVLITINVFSVLSVHAGYDDGTLFLILNILFVCSILSRKQSH